MKKTLAITVFRNGDQSDPGHPLKLDQKKFKNLEQCIDEINYELELAGLSHGYEVIFSPHGRKIKDVKRLHSGKKYVLAKDATFIKAAYGKSGRSQSAPADRARSEPSRSSKMSNRSGSRSEKRSEKRHRHSSAPERRDEGKKGEKHGKRRRSKNKKDSRHEKEIREMPDHEDPLLVVFYQNGQVNDPGMEFEIPVDALGDQKEMVDFVNTISLESGQPKVRKIYRTDGKQIIHPKQMKDKGEYVGALGRFIRVKYGERAKQLSLQRKKINSQRRLKKQRSLRAEEELLSECSTCSDCSDEECPQCRNKEDCCGSDTDTCSDSDCSLRTNNDDKGSRKKDQRGSSQSNKGGIKSKDGRLGPGPVKSTYVPRKARRKNSEKKKRRD